MLKMLPTLKILPTTSNNFVKYIINNFRFLKMLSFEMKCF